MLNISIQKVLGKIEEELNQAKGIGSEARIRERIHAIKALCELALDESSRPAEIVATQTPRSPAPVVQTQMLQSVGQPQKMHIDEESNGDSLFDF